MKLRTLRECITCSPLFAIAVLAAVLCALAPAPALADDNVAYVTDFDGNKTYYTDGPTAVSNGYGLGKTVVMLQDWKLSSTLTISADKSITIDMNGHKIRYGGGSVIKLEKGSQLVLKSSAPGTKFTYKGYNATGDQEEMQLTSGGLVTGGWPHAFNTHGAGVLMEESSHLALEGVSVAGNYADEDLARQGDGGGIYAEKGCVIDIRDGATVEHNMSQDNGAGIYVNGSDVTININNASVSNNYAKDYGGGIYCDADVVTINMEKNAKIDSNTAKAGGGIYLNKTDFTITSTDKTGTVSNNTARYSSTSATKGRQSGGGIHVDSRDYGSYQRGKINGLIIKGNYSAYDGGGIELDQELTQLIDCKIVDNTAKYEGGGVYVCAGRNTIDGCTITGNACNLAGKNYEGGGVFVWYNYDIELTGVCVIKNNTRGKNTSDYDDVFLRESTANIMCAYITGGVSEGSSVGIRTGTTGKRRVGKDLKTLTTGAYFIDLEGYHAELYEDDSDLWQLKGSEEYGLYLNGKHVGSYAYQSSVLLNQTSSWSDSKVFWYWDREKATGLNPIDEYITESGAYKPALSFRMPACEVRLTAVYADRITAGQLDVTAPVAGKELESQGTFKRTDEGAGGEGDVSVKVIWYEVSSDGALTQATGTAKYGATYVAHVTVPEKDTEGRFFSRASAVAVTVKSDAGESAAATIKTQREGSLYVETAQFTTEKPTVTSIEGASVTVEAGKSEAELRALFPTQAAAKTNAGAAVKLNVSTAEGDLGSLIKDGVVVMPEGGKATVQIPVTSDEVQLTDELNAVAVEVTVTEAPVVQPAVPTVSPDEGTYSTSDDPATLDDKGRLKLTAQCETADATIKYRLDYCDTEWVEGEEKPYSEPIYLEKKENDQRLYWLEIWSEKDGVESEHRYLLYTIDDIQTKTVTVKSTDTGLQPSTNTLEETSVRKGSAFTVVAPDRPGYMFEKWSLADGEESTDVMLTLDAVDDDTTVTAVYNPVVSEINIDIDAPVAHGILSQAASTVEVKAGGSTEWTDITSLLSSPRGNPAITWSPAGDEAGEADHVTTYTASLEFKKSDEATDVKYVLDNSATIDCSRTPIEGGSAYIAEAADGTKLVCIAFPTTGPWENPTLSPLADVELTYERAWGYQSNKDAGGDPSWGLPKGVKVSCPCGDSTVLGIKWGEVSGFDKSDLGAQEFKVTGTVEYPSYIDHDGATETVEVTVKVAAAETAAAPKASLESGTYAGTQAVSLGCDTEDAVIRYTTDGSEPDENSPVYDDGIVEVAHNTVIKAKAYREAMLPSETATFTYAITHTVTFDSAGGSAVAVQEVEDGQVATEPAAPTRDGYTFLGWTLDGEAYDFATPVTGDLTLTATWEKNGDEPDVEPDDEQSDDKKDEPKRETLPDTGDAPALVGLVAAAGAVIAVLGARRRKE